VLTLQNNVSLSDLTALGSLKAGSLKARAWDTLRAVVQGMARTRAVAPIRSVVSMPGWAPMRDGAYRGGIAGTRGPAPYIDRELLRIIPRGVERC
jgi:hypothetical protein